MGLYIKQFWATPQISHYGEIGEVEILTTKICFYFLEMCPEIHCSIFIHSRFNRVYWYFWHTPYNIDLFKECQMAFIFQIKYQITLNNACILQYLMASSNILAYCSHRVRQKTVNKMCSSAIICIYLTIYISTNYFNIPIKRRCSKWPPTLSIYFLHFYNTDFHIFT